jgi:cytochrome o ubiquinol oxidase subunit 2
MQMPRNNQVSGLKAVKATVALSLLALLSGCQADVLYPAGDVAARQRDLLLVSTGLMLLIIIPVIALTIWFAWRYRASNAAARYEPDWDHSTQLELIIWSAPLLIIICLGAITWMGTHILDPYRPIDRIAAGAPLTADTEPLRVDVVALDWKWLFIYPQLGIATVNELAAPRDRPIDFSITSSSVMNSFYVPALAGQIYAMPGMETRLHAVINQTGDYEGFSANYSGAGFSGMRFHFLGQTAEQFDQWVARVKGADRTLDRDGYLRLERPSEMEPVQYYTAVAPELYHDVLNLCVQPGKMCMDDMMRIDAKGGSGLAGINNTLPLAYDKFARRGSAPAASPTFVAARCDVAHPLGMTMASASPRVGPKNPAGLVGAGLPRPGAPYPDTLDPAAGSVPPS